MVEGDTVELEVELTNVPEGGVIEPITVYLKTGYGTTAYRYSDYDGFYRIVRIPRGESRTTLELNVFRDDLTEDDETLNIHVSRVEYGYGGQSYEQSDSGVSLTIVDNEDQLTVAVQYGSETWACT